MFWGSFTYEKKGPCHIYRTETKKEKLEADKVIAEINELLEPKLREEWELNTSMRRLKLRNLGGKKPTWKWDAKHGKLVRRQGDGIDWWRYRQQVLIPKLFPFYKECLGERPKMVI